MIARVDKFSNTATILFLFQQDAKDAEFIKALPNLVAERSVGIKTLGKHIKKIQIAWIDWKNERASAIYTLKIDKARLSCASNWQSTCATAVCQSHRLTKSEHYGLI